MLYWLVAKNQKKSINNMCSIALKDLMKKILGLTFPSVFLWN